MAEPEKLVSTLVWNLFYLINFIKKKIWGLMTTCRAPSSAYNNYE